MSFICPECSGGFLEIVSSLELPPDSEWDEITLQVVECSDCGFAGAAVYEESRRGALDSEAWEHRGYRLEGKFLGLLVKEIAACPEPRNSGCQCAAHRKWNQIIDARGRWLGLLGSAGEFPIIPAGDTRA
jgi:hypothetical protein